MKHKCDLGLPHGAFGSAVKECVEDDEGRLWAGNGEYESQVDYCPYCGFKAPRQIKEEERGHRGRE